MCGIFGLVSSSDAVLPVHDVERVVNRLFRLSETRGKEASGLTLMPTLDAERVLVLKSPATASALMRESGYLSLFTPAGFGAAGLSGGMVFGHTRLVTNGSQLSADNNQPVHVDGVIAVHNGIIVNVDELWIRHPELQRRTEVDTEVLVALMAASIKAGRSPVDAVRQAFAEIKGTASCVIAFPDREQLILATNHGSLYLAEGNPRQPVVFASESYTLRQLLASRVGVDFTGYRITHVPPNQGVVIELRAYKVRNFRFDDAAEQAGGPGRAAPMTIETRTLGKSTGMHSVFDIRKVTVPARFEAAVERARVEVASLRRCTRCILTETVPFIQFDAQGVCNFCRDHKPVVLGGREALETAIRGYRRPGSEPDCVCSISGGRDSCYGLHYVVKELGMKPIAYTYDWGMVTDLARRNIARMCSQLGVEHILISANIPLKRANIRKNVEAWLHKPHIGMIPLFMAGDKQFVWYGNRVKRENNLELDFFTFNLFEKTQFKEEYTGIQFWRPGADADKLGEELGVWRGVKLCSYYGSQFLTNWKYLNSSLLDTFYGFVTYYVMPQNFLALFRYIQWREEEVVGTLLRDYEWELATDTQASWRIGDGTASFYNYIYYMLGGFTEHDTLRSGQVREGHLDRAEALRLVERDNAPRWDSFKWYCDVVGLDFERTVDRINEMPRVSPKLSAIPRSTR